MVKSKHISPDQMRSDVVLPIGYELVIGFFFVLVVFVIMKIFELNNSPHGPSSMI